MTENRVNPSPDDGPTSNEGAQTKQTLLTTLQTYDQLPEEMQSIVMQEAGRLTESFEDLTQEALKTQSKQGMERDPISALMYPLMLEMAFHKIQLGAVSSALADMVKDPGKGGS